MLSLPKQLADQYRPLLWSCYKVHSWYWLMTFIIKKTVRNQKTCWLLVNSRPGWKRPDWQANVLVTCVLRSNWPAVCKKGEDLQCSPTAQGHSWVKWSLSGWLDTFDMWLAVRWQQQQQQQQRNTCVHNVCLLGLALRSCSAAHVSPKPGLLELRWSWVNLLAPSGTHTDKHHADSSFVGDLCWFIDRSSTYLVYSKCSAVSNDRVWSRTS